jgi:uncharacterized protein DUF4242
VVVIIREPICGTAESRNVHCQRDFGISRQRNGQPHTRFLNYWFDEGTGTVSCLVEAPTAADAIAGHKEAHGLLPDTIDEVTERR